MARKFALTGLLRLRSIQQREAAERLSRASITARQTEARDRQARAALASTGTEAVDVRTLAAIAASRVAARSQLAELTNLADVHNRERDEAEREHTRAKRNEKSIEKLEQAHVKRERADELRAEQAVLDEIATTRWKEPEQ
ncbi:flagellar FliJ family protein [Paramicrobacterium agarici]|uniref:Flagellar FliJ protein n=1 Tax=Paramicrobacterium agarici TaxID=630514 RepID=A0A2A9DWU2_9MICO|nr:flagellar FliJ family protein [Microbacterium agarici]PFG30605.1 flagellar FliJ protein [Microbacterium agarici]TQO23623.1 flagellar FliJ protein [Microbacterium agarici]